MPYVPFTKFFPELAPKETRTITILRDGDYDLPGDEYAYVESFCDEPGCDCRRVFLVVYSSKRNQMVAVIAYGWESRKL